MSKQRSFQHIARLIKDRRLAHHKGYSQAELSELLGYKNGQFISNVERGICAIPLKTLKKVGEVLEISKDELMKAMLNDYQTTLDNYLVSENTTQVNPQSRPHLGEFTL